MMSMKVSKQQKRATVEPLIIDKEPLDVVIQYKYLGITLDQQLNFKLHTNRIINTFTHKLYNLFKIRNMLTTQIALNVYKSTKFPIIDYSDIFYNAAPTSLLHKIRILQNRANRIIAKLASRTNTTTYQRTYNI